MLSFVSEPDGHAADVGTFSIWVLLVQTAELGHGVSSASMEAISKLRNDVAHLEI